MALPCFMLTFSLPLLVTGVWDRHLRLPIRVSSLPKHELLPPLTYTITEDIVAVDGGGGLMFRQAWRHRYEASRVIRRVCRVTAVAWGASGCTIAAILIAAAWTAPTDTAYGLGYGIPWLWALTMSSWTVHYVQVSLVREREEWADQHVHKEMELHLKEKDIDREVDMLQRMRSVVGVGSEMKKEEWERLVREGMERRAVREAAERRRASQSQSRDVVPGVGRAVSDSAASDGSPVATEGRDALRRPRTLSARLHGAATRV